MIPLLHHELAILNLGSLFWAALPLLAGGCARLLVRRRWRGSNSSRSKRD